MEKVCTGCKIAKPVAEFHKNKYAKSGLQAKCKPCKSSERKDRRAGVVCKFCPRPVQFVSIPACYTHGVQIRNGITPSDIKNRRQSQDFTREDELLCLVCDNWKSKSEFKYRGEKLRYESACRPCSNLRKRASRHKMSLDEVRRISTSACEACGSTENLCIDHFHSCCPGESTCGNCFRGVLCASCNTALGLLKDSPERLNGLLAYVDSKSLVAI